VLGAVLLAGATLLEPVALEERLTPGHFYRDQHARVYEAMLALHRSREPIDELTVTQELRERGALEEVSGKGAVDELAGWVPAAGNGRAYARIVRDLARRRELFRCSYLIQELALEGDADPDQRIAHAAKLIGELLDHSHGMSARHRHEHLFDRAAELVKLANGDQLLGLATGIRELDETLHGMRPGELVLVAARPGQGKSVLAQHVAIHNALQGTGTLCCSLEMSEAELDDRHLSSRAGVPFARIRSCQLTDRHIERITAEAAAWARDTPPLIDTDRVPLTVSDIRAEALRWQRRLPDGLGLVVIDYLQLLSPSDGRMPRYEAVSEISRSLKVLAKELGVVVFAVAQLSREAERRADKRPQLADLRDSGQLEQDANTVLLLHRPGAYDEQVDPQELEIIVAKARNAETGSIAVRFEGAYQRLRDS
jgi:replicative DNA helicase